ncbi:MAG: stp2, partial [Clostridiales bacterium]|nr:stp2 [Clostridiales bacterium]
MFGAKSDIGMVREINEDSFNVILGKAGQPSTFIIADGMGGHNSGEVASKMAVDFISNYLYQSPELISLENNASCENKIPEALKELMLRANAEIFSQSQQYPENFGMGTTLIVAVICENDLYIGHVGDSRLYLISGDNIERITTDHSFIEELIKNGSLT